MKRYVLWPVLATWLAACGTSAAPTPVAPDVKPGTVVVEVIYLNHPPVRPVLTAVDTLLANYGERVSVARYDLDTPEGADLAKAKGLTEHTPLAIFINGSMDFTVGGRAVQFYSFPQGQGTGMVAEGVWTIEDLQDVLDEATSQSP